MSKDPLPEFTEYVRLVRLYSRTSSWATMYEALYNGAIEHDKPGLHFKRRWKRNAKESKRLEAIIVEMEGKWPYLMEHSLEIIESIPEKYFVICSN